MNNTIGPRGEALNNMQSCLRETFGFPVTLWDERLTTMAAERMLIDADVSRKKRKLSLIRWLQYDITRVS